MKRLAQSYLTISTILIVLANLALVVLYGRQFGLRAEGALSCVGKTCTDQLLLTNFLIINAFLIGLLLVGWFVVIKIFHLHRQS